jgi:hypothetical protein
MAKINLKVNSDRAFGKYLPSVYIDRITVNHPFTDAGIADKSIVTFDVDLSINFTFDGADKNLSDIKSWINKYLDDLYLYSFISPYTRFNQQLENKRLNLRDLFNAYTPPTSDSFTSDSPMYPYIVAEMKESFARKNIDFYGEGVVSSGMEALEELGYADWVGSTFGGDTPDDGLKALYYYSNYSDIMASVNTPGSIMETLFYGAGAGEFPTDANLSGPWHGGDDLPDKVRYASIDSATLSGGEMVTFDDYYVDDYYTDEWFRINNLSMYGDNFFDEASSGYMDGAWETDGIPSGPVSFMGLYKDEFLTYYMFDDESESVVYHKTKLTDLLGDSELDNAYLTKREVYDDQGNEILKIENIQLKFQYDQGSADSVFLETIEKLFFVSTIGLDIDALDSTPRGIFNNNFGGITFETVLKFGAADQSFNEVFVENATGAAYDGIPLQALNGKYYAEEPISRRRIVNKFGAIIRDYKSNYPRDSKLAQNIKNLQYLLATNEESTELFSEFKKFQRTYTDKSQVTASGRFYSEVVNEMVVFSKKIMLQMEVARKIIMNSIVIDLRGTLLLSESLGFPDPSGIYQTGNFVRTSDDLLSNDKLEHPSNDYIPRNWINFSRRTVETMLFDASSEYALLSMGQKTDYDEMLDDYLDSLVEAYGGDPDFAESMDAGIRSEILTEHQYHNSERAELVTDRTGQERREDIDFVVENRGYFFFDWEKALHTQSNLAKICTISKLHRFLGLTVPYEYFQVESVKMIREELEFTSREGEFESISLGDHNFWGVKQVMHMTSPKSYPRSNNSTYSMIRGNMSEDDSEDIAIAQQYGKPRIKIWSESGGTERSAYLKFVNFDVCTSRYESRLEGYGNFTPYGVDYALERGYKIRDGYRLMAFAFRDYMDDDIAYYNTQYEGDMNRRDTLELFNYLDEPYTPYTIQILVKDKTVDFFIGSVYGLLIRTYNELKDYLAYAEELCSYNNITGVFNQFFIDAVTERYADTTSKPWVKAALIINSCKQVFFQSFSDETDTITEENIIMQSVALVNKFSPEKGTLQGLQSFVSEYKRFLLYFNPNIATIDDIEVSVAPPSRIYNRILELSEPPITELDIDPDGAVSIPAGLEKMHEFANCFSIDQPIFGDYVLDAYEEGDRSATAIDAEAFGGGGSYPGLFTISHDGEEIRYNDPGLNLIEDLMGSHHASLTYNYAMYKVLTMTETDGEYFPKWNLYNLEDMAGVPVQNVVNWSMGYLKSTYLRSIVNLMMGLAHNMLGGGYQGPSTTHPGYVGPVPRRDDVSLGSIGTADRISEMAGGNRYSVSGAGGSSKPFTDLNIPGLNAQSLLYVIRKELFPITGHTTLTGDPAEDHVGSGHLDHLIEEWQDLMVRKEDLLALNAGAHETTIYEAEDWTGRDILDILGLNNDFVDAEGGDFSGVGGLVEFRKYLNFRQALKFLHNGLLDICNGITGSIAEFDDGAPGMTDAGARSRYQIANILRSYLDKDDPIGPDWNNLRVDGEIVMDDKYDRFDPEFVPGQFIFVSSYYYSVVTLDPGF